MDRNEKSPLEWDWENHGLFSAEKEVEISEFGNRSSKSSISASIDSSSKEGLKISKSGLSKKKELTSVEPLIGLMLGKRTYFEDVTSIGNNSTKNSTCSTSPVPPTALVKKTRVSHQSIPNSCCQVEGCGIDLSGAKDYHRKNRVCESHSKCPKVIIAGLERRFCQQCSRFHDLREFDLKKRSCRRRLSDHNARRRKPQSDLSFNSTGLSSPFYGDRHKMNFLINRSPFGQMRPTASSTLEDSCGFSITHSKGSWIKTTKAGGLDAQLQFSNSELSNAVPALCRDLDKILSFKGAPAEVFTQGDRHKMNFLINRSPFGHMRPTASSTWEDSCGFSITHSKGSWIKTTKAVGLDAQLQFSNSELSNAVPALCRDLDKILSFKGAPAEVFTQGVEAFAVPASDLDVGGPDLGHALSLLSTDSWVHSADPGQSILSHFVNTTSHNNSAMLAVNSTMMRYWQEEQTLVPQQTRVFPFDLHSANGGRYLEFPLSKSPLETLFLDSGQILPILDGHFLEFKT